MKINKLDEDFEKKKRVTFQCDEDRCFAITRDFCKYAAECGDHDEIDFDPYSEDYFTDEEKEEIKQMLEYGKFDDELEWD